MPRSVAVHPNLEPRLAHNIIAGSFGNLHAQKSMGTPNLFHLLRRDASGNAESGCNGKVCASRLLR